jgi:periplasmic protein TonB
MEYYPMTQGQSHTTLHDIAFEGRNKAYGAYVLRKTSNRRIGFSLMVSVVIFLLITALFYVGMEWIRTHQPVYMMPSVSIGLDNTIPSIFSSGLESIKKEKKNATRTVTSKPSPDWQTVSDKAVEESKELTSKDSEKNEGLSDGGNSGHTGAGIPWGTGEVFLSADVIPQFEGGREGLSKFLGKNVRYPEEAIDKRQQGTVLVCFVVTSEGSVKDVKIVRGVSPELDNEALRVVASMPLWRPGLRAGKPVNIVMTIPIRFDLHLHFSR